jgi:outer membrane protein TolC
MHSGHFHRTAGPRLTGRICGCLLTLSLCLTAAALAGAEWPAAPLKAVELRARIVDRHPQVVAARAALEEARALQRGAGSWSDPELEGRLLRHGNGDTEIEGALRFAIPWSGRLAAARQAARLAVELARLDFETARHRAAVETDRLLARLSCSRSLVELHQSLSARSSEQARLAAQRQAANIADPLDVSLVLADAARDRRALIESRSEEDAITSTLLLLADVPSRAEAIETVPLHWDPPALQRDVLLDRAREQGPELAAARLRLERTAEDVKRAGRARLPDLRLGPAVQREVIGTSWGLALGLPLPLFGRTRADLQAARARRQGAAEALDLEDRALPLRVDTLLARLESLEQQLSELSGEAAEATEQAFRLARIRWSTGTIDVLHLLSAHRAFAEMRIERLETLLQLHETWFDLSLAVGEPLDAAHLSAAEETGR